MLTRKLRFSSRSICDLALNYLTAGGKLYHNKAMLANMKQTAEFVEFFRLHGVKHTFQKGDIIIRPGESPPGVFYIYQGLVKAFDITKYNEENLLIIRKQDE